MTTVPLLDPPTPVLLAPSQHRTAEAAARDTTGAWAGRNREYDLLKEFVIALVVVSLLAAALAAVFSSPDVHQVTLSSWSRSTPNDFVATAATELDGTSGTATYGAPYTHTPGVAQKIGPVSLQHIAGVTHPIDSAADFVVRPLSGIPGDSALSAALAQWGSATPQARQSWASSYDDALQKAPDNDPAKVAVGSYGPVPVMIARLLALAQTGGLDGALLLQGSFYQSDYTRPLLFIADGAYLGDKAAAEHLSGEQWGMMNETGSFPGQAWLWLYTFWYQVKPFSTSGNADALVMALMGVLSLGLICVPFLPGVRSIPRWIPVHRLIWRDYYRNAGT
ncbi:MAG: hypothetical protein JWP11_820 [Frankiales bacterium]|nr:hypothetical protein [Frankiales bacterium]